ncbi:hypothetical protein LINGRAHAP2_LOCUS33845 [Linum grandiflorum]
MDKASMKLIFLVVLFIFVAGKTSNIGAEGRINQIPAVPCFQCHDPCICIFQNCDCSGNFPFTSKPHHDPMELAMEPAIPSEKN